MTEQVQFILKARRILARVAKNRRHPRRVAFCAAWRAWAHDRPYAELSAALDRVGALLDADSKTDSENLIAAIDAAGEKL